MSAVIEAGLTAEQSQMVQDNLGLIGFTINRFNRALIDDTYTDEDAWQEGFFGLCRAVQRFDPDRNIRFSTYAVQWIRQTVQRGAGHAHGRDYRRAIARGSKDFVRPVSLNRTRKTQDSDSEELGDLIPDPDADTEALGLSQTRLDELLRLAERQCRDDIDRALLTVLADPAQRSTRSASQVVADRFGVTVSAVSMRAMRLQSRCGDALAAFEATAASTEEYPAP